MDFVTDLHLHSKYSRAVSKDMTLPIIVEYARKKGFEIVSAADWTHPLWLRELKTQLEETNEGLFQLKTTTHVSQFEKPVYFLLSVEISSIYSQQGKVHRIHNLVLSPSFATCEKINAALRKRGCNLSSDGRPIIGLSARDLLELILSIDERTLLIPAHIWTPWFSLYGAHSGFDSLEACFGDMSKYVYGIETGLSSDPEMNWQIKDLDTRSILSFSDAHSPAKMGREATVFRLEKPSFEHVRKAIMAQSTMHDAEFKMQEQQNRVLYTIEFYPEEGKYHYNGHRNCNVIETPEETRRKGNICPVCKRTVTVGVMQRVEDLADESVKGVITENDLGIKWIRDPQGGHPPFIKIVPLNEIIAESYGMRVGAGKVTTMFDALCQHFGDELTVLLKTPITDIVKAGNKLQLFPTDAIAEGIKKVRAGNIVIRPGFDGEYGIVRIWHEKEQKEESSKGNKLQESQLGIDF